MINFVFFLCHPSPPAVGFHRTVVSPRRNCFCAGPKPIDLQVSFRQQTLEPHVILLQFTPPLYRRFRHLAEPSPPRVKRYVTDPMPPAQCHNHLIARIRFPQYRYHLFFTNRFLVL
jgi:hypothetical protein